MDVEFDGDMWYWRGPAPHHFVSVPDADCAALASAAQSVSYGWGMVPARVRVGDTEWATALWPKNGGYIVPLKTAVRTAENLHVGDTVTIRLSVDA